LFTVSVHPGREGMLTRAAGFEGARKQRDRMSLLGSFLLLPILFHLAPSLLDGATTCRAGLPPLVNLLWKHLTDTFVCFINLLGTSQAKQVDSQDQPSITVGLSSRFFQNGLSGNKGPHPFQNQCVFQSTYALGEKP
jgi:hypothetical protein